MNKNRMEQLRDFINAMLDSDNYDSKILLKKSQELDKLIVQTAKESIYADNGSGNDFTNEFNSTLQKIELFEKMYDSMRIIDPIKKEVLELNENQLLRKEYECYKLLGRKHICENCISMRAYNEDDTIIKMEYNEDKVYTITAVPIFIKAKKLIVELFKDTTNSLYLQSEKFCKEVKVVSAIEHMNDMVVKDDLTNLYNRKFIDEKLPIELMQASLKNEPLSIIFADLDFFKSINDEYGHIVGDQILKEFAKELKKCIRKEIDWVARYGGEEFLICLPNTDIKTTKVIAERIRNNIMNKEFVVDNKKINLTGSFGVHTVCDGKECLTVDGIIKMADQKLYKAKEEGRNRVK